MKIYLNGKIVPEQEAVVSVFDHGLLYGDGVFEGIRAYHGKVFRLVEHVDRLYRSAAAIALNIPMSREDMCAAVVATCKANGINDGYVRLIVTRGVGSLGLNPYLCKEPQVIIIAGAIQLYPKELYETGMNVVTVGTIRNHVEALNPRIKSLNYLNNILAKIEAINAGVLECIMLNPQGFVAEASGDNIFVIRGKTLITPPVWCGALEGITREVVMQIAPSCGLAVKEDVLTRYDLYTADELFLTGTAAEIISVVNVDRRVIGGGKPGPYTLELLKAFAVETKNTGVPIT
ncbi:MAG TPA: branched-chain-amino-acid transaminase [Kiritimatiellia bacterium]|nr:branched-chain-amino-acid transaminase [Kiritimatiellia bacterium]HMP34857.1 branched-chain-amino-acid transaminase [Kiritimatiellia bacterium]